MKKLVRTVIIVIASFFGAAFAAEYFLTTLPITYTQDMGYEFQTAETAFRTLQITAANRGWRPGDKFDVAYIDGVIATFVASTRGVMCINGRCLWASTIPLDDTPTIKQGNSTPRPQVTVQVAPGQVAPMALIDLHALTATTTWVITQGPATTINSDGSINILMNGTVYRVPATDATTNLPAPNAPPPPPVSSGAVNEQDPDYVRYNQIARSGAVNWGEPPSADVPRAFWNGGPLGGYGTSPIGVSISVACPLCFESIRRDNL